MKPMRPYQQRCVDSVFKEWETVTSTLAVAPTGTGKTRIAAEIVKRILPRRTMFVAHRKELIFQARNAIDEIVGGSGCEIEMAELYARHHQNAEGTVVAMVQSLISKNGNGRRMDRFKPEEFGLLIVDEFHHAVSDSYREVINHFKRNPFLKILGLTATPDRMDEEALGQICDSVAFDYEIIDAIQDGWLCPISQVMVPVAGLDFSHIKTVAGDLNQSDLAAIMEAESVIQGVVQPTLELMFEVEPHGLDPVPVNQWGAFLTAHNDPKRTLVFTVSVNQAEMLCNVFNRVVDGLAQWVCGKTPDDRRADLLARYGSGEIPIMVNCQALVEGYDNPGVQLIVMARPTKSRAFYSQMVGRATRPLTGITDGLEAPELRREAIAASSKKNMLVVDFTGNSGKHKLMTSADILGGNASDEAISRTIRMLEKLERPADVAETLKQAELDIRAETEARRQAEEARKAKIVARASYGVRYINPFDVLDITPVRSRGWDTGKQLSGKQQAIILKQGVNPDTLSYAEGRQLIGEIFSRWDDKKCSIKQAAVLKRYRLPVDASREQASKWLDAIARNRWVLPKDLVQSVEKVPF